MGSAFLRVEQGLDERYSQGSLAAEVLGFGLAPECSVFAWKDDCPETSDWLLLACGFQEGLPSGKIVCVFPGPSTYCLHRVLAQLKKDDFHEAGGGCQDLAWPCKPGCGGHTVLEVLKFWCLELNTGAGSGWLISGALALPDSREFLSRVEGPCISAL